MEIQEYIDQRRQIYDLFLTFIDSKEEESQSYANLIEYLELKNIKKNTKESTYFIQLILHISENHNRRVDFFGKIEKILLYFSDFITSNFQSFDFFDIFQTNRRIVLFLLENKLIPEESFTILSIFKQKDQNKLRFRHLYYSALKLYVGKRKRKRLEFEISQYYQGSIESFEEKCKIGENDSYLCKLIREDLIDDFISYVSQTCLPINDFEVSSIFETNQFLLDKKPTLIEYAAFFGSIQIFKYLQMNNVELTPSLWLYAIHGSNAEIIHFLIENHIEPKDNSYWECFEEAIKCHHNEIADFLRENILSEKDISNFDSKFFNLIFEYQNMHFLQNDHNEYYLLNAIENNDFSFVKLLLDTKKFDVNSKITNANTKKNFKLYFNDIINSDFFIKFFCEFFVDIQKVQLFDEII